jgi:hypothetical protein
MTPELDDDDVTSDLSGSYLNAADFDNGIGRRFTIASVDKQVYEAKNGRPEEQKRRLVFDDGRCLTLSAKTNIRLLAKWFGPKTSAWIGKDVTVYRDESITYGGRLTGGWRLRKPSPHDPRGMETPDTVPF